MILPEIVVYYLLLFAGFTVPEAHVMTCVAKYESAYKTTAINLHNRNGSIDVGLFQINTIHFNSIPYCALDGLENPVNNVMCTKYVYDLQGYSAWYGYLKNKKECNSYKVNIKK